MNTPGVAVPVDAKVGVAAIPCMRARRNLLGAAVEASDESVLEVVVAEFGAVVFHADVDGETLGQQNMGGDAVHIPGVPALSESRLDLLILRRARRVGALIGSLAG